MYHSGVNAHHPRTIGRSGDCHLVLDDASVSRRHATVAVTPEGYLAVQDLLSANGTWLQRNGRWIRVRRAILGTRDRLRLGERELPLERLVDLFGGDARIRLREGYSVRGRPLLRDELTGDPQRHRVVLANPRRNPLTGDIEENR
jgi:pSer/pThr/pTyr-binding forkhead associated (FHA) protein